MLTYKSDTFNCHGLLFADWKRVSGKKKKIKTQNVSEGCFCSRITVQ